MQIQFALKLGAGVVASVLSMVSVWAQVPAAEDALKPLLEITAQPLNQAVTLGGEVTFSISARGKGELAFKWFRDGSDIPGATGQSLTINPVRTSDATAYTVSVTEVDPLRKVRAVVAGKLGHSAVLLKDGSLWSAGANDKGQLGDGTLVNRSSLGFVASDVTGVSLGSNHTLYIKSNGDLWGVGDRSTGQLGDGNDYPSPVRTIPFRIESGVASASAGYVHTMFVKKDSTLWGTGQGTWGQLGTGRNETLRVPVQVASGVLAVSVGLYHTAYITSDGSLFTVGLNNYGQLGVSGLSQSFIAQKCATNVVKVAAGWYNTFFIKSDKSLWGTGLNSTGVFGASSGSVSTPQKIADDAIDVSSGLDHVLFLRTDGTLWAVGKNNNGQLGDGTVVAKSVPVKVADAITQVSAGGEEGFSFFVTREEVAWGVGGNNKGQLGVSLPSSVTSPRPFAGMLHSEGALLTVNIPPLVTESPKDASVLVGSTVELSVSVSGAPAPSFAWMRDGVEIVGATNQRYRIPLVSYFDVGTYSVKVTNVAGSVTSAGALLSVFGPPEVVSQPPLRNVVSLGGESTLDVKVGGAQAVQWYKNGVAIPGATRASYIIKSAAEDIHEGWYQLVASNSYGSNKTRVAFLSVSLPIRVVGWGNNSQGQLSVPADLGNVIDIAAGGNHCLALKQDGSVVSWGPVANYTTIPSGREALGEVVAIAAGPEYSMALTSSGNVRVWGANTDGQLFVPGSAQGVVAISAGFYHCLALRSDGSVVGWGRSAQGQTAIPSSMRPVVTVGAGGAHSVAMSSDGTLFSWGNNSVGQTDLPNGLYGVVSVSVGQNHSLVLKVDGTVASWGGGAVAWGGNSAGSLAVPSDANSINKVSAGYYHSLAVRNNGSVVAWGQNDRGQTNVPTGLTAVRRIKGGLDFSIAGYINALDRAPLISSHPQSVMLRKGAIGKLSVVVDVGTAPGTTFQWRRNGFAISGATGSSFIIPEARDDTIGEYSVVVTNYLGTSVSESGFVSLMMDTAPTVVAAPANVTIPNGERTQLKVTATGTGALSYQWYQGQSGSMTAPVLGADSSTFTTPALTASTTYWVRITDSNGAVTNSPTVTVTVSTTSPLTVTQKIVGSGYSAGGGLIVTNTITYSGTAPSRIDWSTLLPTGWKYLGSGGSEGVARPPYESGDLLEWSWTTVPASPIKFTYTVSVPAGTTGDQVIASLVTSQAAGTNYQTMAKPDPLVIRSASLHSADSNRDGKISLTELTRVIELYNYRSGTTRTGQYKAQTGTEDGFNPGP